MLRVVIPNIFYWESILFFASQQLLVGGTLHNCFTNSNVPAVFCVAGAKPGICILLTFDRMKGKK